MRSTTTHLHREMTLNIRAMLQNIVLATGTCTAAIQNPPAQEFLPAPRVVLSRPLARWKWEIGRGLTFDESGKQIAVVGDDSIEFVGVDTHLGVSPRREVWRCANAKVLQVIAFHSGFAWLYAVPEGEHTRIALCTSAGFRTPTDLFQLRLLSSERVMYGRLKHDMSQCFVVTWRGIWGWRIGDKAATFSPTATTETTSLGYAGGSFVRWDSSVFISDFPNNKGNPKRKGSESGAGAGQQDGPYEWVYNPATGKMFGCGGPGTVLQAYDPADGTRATRSVPRSEAETITSASSSPYVLIGFFDRDNPAEGDLIGVPTMHRSNEALLIDASSLKSIKHLDFGNDLFRLMALSPDGSTVAVSVGSTAEYRLYRL
ncbi:MAG: hypothetical protein ACYC96_03625 [Fimbriimonadaceae bacterium]